MGFIYLHKKRNFYFFSVLALSFITHLASAQKDPLFSLYLNNTVVVNPAYAGSRESVRLAAVQRWQWVGLEGAPATTSFSANLPLRDSKVGLGLSLLNDEIGPTNSTAFSFDLAYHLKLSEDQVTSIFRTKKGKGNLIRRRKELKGVFLSFGFKTGLDFTKVALDKLRSTIVNDPALLESLNNKVRLNLGLGVYLYSARYYLGFAVPRIFSKQMDYENQNGSVISFKERPIYLNGGFVMDLNPNYKFKPSFMLRFIHGVQPSLDLNASVIFQDIFSFGLGHRLGESINAMFSYRFLEEINLAYNYDFSYINLSGFNASTHEISFSLDLKYKKTDTPCQTYF